MELELGAGRRDARASGRAGGRTGAPGSSSSRRMPDARDVGVDGHVAQAVAEQQHAGRRLAPDAGQRRTGSAATRRTGASRIHDEVEIADRPQLRPGCAGLHLRDAARADRRLDVLDRARRAPPPTTSKRSRRRRKATSRLRSLVDCESTVSTSSPSGSPCGAITGTPYIARSRSRTARTRRAGGRVQATAAHRIFPRHGAGHRAHRDAGRAAGVLAQRRPAATRPCSTCTACRTPAACGADLLERTGGVAPDLPGFGRSGKRGDGDFTMTGLARWLDGFLDLAGLDRVRLVVHDWGAVGLLWAHAQPRARRAPGGRRRRAVPARLPLARPRARLAHAAGAARSPWA